MNKIVAQNNEKPFERTNSLHKIDNTENNITLTTA